MQQVAPLPFQGQSLRSPNFQLRKLPLPLDQTDILDMLRIIHSQIRKFLGRGIYIICLRDPLETWVLTGGRPCTEHPGLAHTLAD